MNFAIRQLLKSPGFTIIALITLALGIGANTTAFTVLNRILLVSLPFQEPQRMVQIWVSTPQFQYGAQSPGDYFDEKEHDSLLENFSAYYTNRLASLAEPEMGAIQCTTMPVTAEFLPLLGVKARMGRIFTADDAAHHEQLAIISTAYWIKHYKSDSQILGRTVRIDNKSMAIIGVMPPSLDDQMLFNGRIDFWTLDDIAVNHNYRDGTWYSVAARMKPGVTIQQVQAEMNGIAASMAHDFPKTNAKHGLNVIPYPSNTAGDIGTRIIWLIMALSTGVLMIACFNIANLQLIRTTGRGQEISIRLALGCSRRHLIGLLLKESLLLSIAGGALSLVVAKWSNVYVAKYLDIDMPLNFRVIVFGLSVAVLTGALFGIVPAWLASRTEVNSALKQGGRGGTSGRSRHRFRQSLIVAELAVAIVLLAAAGYFVRGLQRISDRQLGWKPDHLLVGYMGLDHDHYGEEGDTRSFQFSEKFAVELRAIPGVDQVVFSNNSPAWGEAAENFVIEGQPAPLPGQAPFASRERVSPGFFKAYEIPLLEGRDFTSADRGGSTNVAIISASMARKYWPNENPIGKRIGEIDPAKPNWAEVIGVVGDTTAAGDLRPNLDRAAFYKPWAQRSNRFITFTIHCNQDPNTLQESVRKTLAKLDGSVALTEIGTPESIMATNLSGFSLVRRLLLQIGFLGLLLASIGIYGVIANLANERTKEVGIRMALGAQAKDVVSLFLYSGLRLVAIGGVIGLIGSFGLLMFLNKALDIVPGNDPRVVIIVFILLISVALFACWLPAHRASKLTPVVALQP
jgi:predicted permease